MELRFGSIVKRLILIILIILFLTFYAGVFMMKEKRIKEMCESFKESAGVEDCTLEYYKSGTSEDFEAKYLKTDE